ncbi:MAG: DUF211 domain-containing protein [Candidatus Thiodiazotropha sp. (ex Monitilora ramsayi)]|nr:DUF211 domain-containing protein [Candidatus Thiodiazotropha sp. (ex Monitilora ramsayi)]
MTYVKRLVLDILKPHTPNVLEFTRQLAEQGDLKVKLSVIEMDDKTETLQVVIEGEDIDFERVQQAITDNGASLHSIDEVEILGEQPDTE